MLCLCDNGSVGVFMCFYFCVIVFFLMVYIVKYGILGKSFLYEVEGCGCCLVMIRVYKFNVLE